MLCGAAALASCNLDTIPTDKYTVETFWETEEGTEAAMTGCYNILTNSALFGDSAPLLEETCTPNAYNYNNAGGYNDIAQGTHTANSSGIIANRWKKCYEGIGRCNTHLNRLPAAVVADDRRVQMEGEAKFLRALYYYMLVTYYNGVPLILEEPVYAHGSLPRASREEVVRAILDDLNDIIDRELLDWQWTKAADSGLSAAEQAWFDLPDEAKPVYNRTCVLVTASGGGVVLIRIADKKAMFYAKPGGNPHSAEVLPDGNVVVASSTGNLLSVYVYNGADSYVSRPAFTMPVHSAHNVVWDRKRGCLWTATGAQLLKLAYNGKRTAPELTQVRSYDMAAGNTDAHDLAPVCGEDAMYVSTNQHVYKFDCAAEKFLDVQIFQQNTIKSISTGPEGYSTIVMRPTSGGSNWWSAEVCDMKGNRLFNRAGYQIYKARWYVENPFGYPEVHTL